MSALAIIKDTETPSLALDVPEGQTFDEWVVLGRHLASGHKALNWWIGDWWAGGQHRYGERAKVAAQGIFGREFSTIASVASVCRSFETCRRRQHLSFSHHQEVAALAPSEADGLLDRAEQAGWSTRDLREEVVRLKVANDQPRYPTWLERREPRAFDRDVAKEAIYDRLVQAAEKGEVCPNADALAEISGVGSISTTVALMHALEDEKRIEVTRYQRGREVTILATGERTAQPHDTTPHWREVKREDVPSPTPAAVLERKPDIAGRIWAAARKKGLSPQDYLLDLVILGWEVECMRDDSLATT